MSLPLTKSVASEPPQEDILRADLYGVLSVLLSRPPTQDILDSTAGLTGDGSGLGEGIAALARVAATMAPRTAEREYNALFIGLGRGELLPFGSFYLTGFLHEKPLARLRDDMARLGIAASSDVKEPEDHIASILEMMGGLIRGSFGPALPLSAQKAFFETHLAPWAGHFFADLEAAEASVLYAPVGKIGAALMRIEAESFRMEN